LRTLLGTGSPVAKSLTSVREYNSSAMPWVGHSCEIYVSLLRFH
jgi:hypothetical protein